MVLIREGGRAVGRGRHADVAVEVIGGRDRDRLCMVIVGDAIGGRLAVVIAAQDFLDRVGPAHLAHGLRCTVGSSDGSFIKREEVERVHGQLPRMEAHEVLAGARLVGIFERIGPGDELLVPAARVGIGRGGYVRDRGIGVGALIRAIA